MYQISANLVHRELRNATFKGKIIATSIKRPDSEYLTSVAVILKRTRLDNLVADGETEVGVIRQN